MQKSDITVTVTGRGELSGDEKIITAAPGRFYVKNGKKYILYELPDENVPGQIVKHMLILRTASLEINKSAPGLKTRILYELGKRTETDYATPQGIISLSFETDSFAVEENDECLVVEISYRILMGDEVLSRNLLRIECLSKNA